MKPTIDLTPRGPRLGFLNLKTRPQGNGGNKNRSGYSQEHAQANLDNEEFNRSIGGISENLGLSGNNAEPILN